MKGQFKMQVLNNKNKNIDMTNNNPTNVVELMSIKNKKKNKTRPTRNYTLARVLEIKHYSKTLFSFKTTRLKRFKFKPGEYTTIGLIIRGELILRNYYISSPTWEDKLEFYSMVDCNDMFTSFLRKITTNSSIIIIKRTSGDMVLSSLTPGKRLFLFCTHTDMPSANSIIFDPQTYFKYNEIIVVLTCKYIQELDYFRGKLRQLIKDQRINIYSRNKLRFYLNVTQEPYPYSNELSWLIKSGMLIADLRTYALNKMDRFIVCCQQQTMDIVILLKSLSYDEGNTKDPGDFIYNRSFIDPNFKTSIDLDVLPWQSKAKHPKQQPQSCLQKEDKNKIRTFNVCIRGIWIWELKQQDSIKINQINNQVELL